MPNINEIEFLTLLGHSSVEHLNKFADFIEDFYMVAINRNQDRIQLIDTLYAIYYKDRSKLHPNSFTESNHTNKFSFESHYSCPFPINSCLKLSYALLVDSFGFNTKFSRKEAIEKMEGLVDNPVGVMYRITHELNMYNKDGIHFGEVVEGGRKLILYEVEEWKDNKPIFKER